MFLVKHGQRPTKLVFGWDKQGMVKFTTTVKYRAGSDDAVRRLRPIEKKGPVGGLDR